MKKASLYILIALGILLIGGGVLVWEKEKLAQKEANKIAEQHQSASETPTTNEPNTITALPVPEPDMVWYDVPELGIRFKVDPVTKEELVYYSNKKWKRFAEFSTRTLTKLEPECAAEKGAPLGTISRVIGTAPALNPCNTGQKVHEYPGGYFCYFMPQADCLGKEKYEANQALLNPTPGAGLLKSKDFWDSMEFTDQEN